jgi:hypothetical protein
LFGRRDPVAVRRLVCTDCRRESDARALGWRAYVCEVEEGKERPEVAIFCPFCAPLESDWPPK